MPRSRFPYATDNPQIRGLLIASALRAGVPVPPDLYLRGGPLLHWAEKVVRTATPHQALALITSQLRYLTDIGDLAPQSLTAMERLIGRYIDFVVDVGGVERFASLDLSIAWRFVNAAFLGDDGQLVEPSVATKHHRRAAVRLAHRLARQLHIDDSDPTLDMRLPRRSQSARRPLTDDEMLLVRNFADSFAAGTRSAPCVALAEATASTGEIPLIRREHIDLRSRRVLLPGSSRIRSRVGRLTAWGTEVLESAMRERKAQHGPIAYAGSAGAASGQASASGAIRQVLIRAGLGYEKDVSPTSVRDWAGRRAYEARERIEDAALALGVASLDTAARTIGHEWDAEARR